MGLQATFLKEAAAGQAIDDNDGEEVRLPQGYQERVSPALCVCMPVQHLHARPAPSSQGLTGIMCAALEGSGQEAP